MVSTPLNHRLCATAQPPIAQSYFRSTRWLSGGWWALRRTKPKSSGIPSRSHPARDRWFRLRSTTDCVRSLNNRLHDTTQPGIAISYFRSTRWLSGAEVIRVLKPKSSGLEAICTSTYTILCHTAPFICHTGPIICHTKPITRHTDPIVCHTGPIIWHADPIIWHTNAIIWHTNPILFHTDPIVFHTDPIVCHTGTLIWHTDGITYHTRSITEHTWPIYAASLPLIRIILL